MVLKSRNYCFKKNYRKQAQKGRHSAKLFQDSVPNLTSFKTRHVLGNSYKFYGWHETVCKRIYFALKLNKTFNLNCAFFWELLGRFLFLMHLYKSYEYAGSDSRTFAERVVHLVKKKNFWLTSLCSLLESMLTLETTVARTIHKMSCTKGVQVLVRNGLMAPFLHLNRTSALFLPQKRTSRKFADHISSSLGLGP